MASTSEIGRWLHHVREASRYEEVWHLLLLCEIHCRERRPVGENHIGNERINFCPFEKLPRIGDAGRGADVIFLFFKQSDEHGRDAAVVFQQ